MPFFLKWAACGLIGGAIGLALGEMPLIYSIPALILILLAPVFYVISFNINWPVLLGRRRKGDPPH